VAIKPRKLIIQFHISALTRLIRLISLIQSDILIIRYMNYIVCLIPLSHFKIQYWHRFYVHVWMYTINQHTLFLSDGDVTSNAVVRRMID